MFHVKHEAWIRDLAALGITLDPGQLEALESYRLLLVDRALPKGMISAADSARLWERHLRDGIRGATEIPPAGRVADLGSGAGIPGIPLAIAIQGSRFVLVERRRGRAAFLESVVDDLRLSNVEVFPRTAEELTGPFEAVLARAYASPAATWSAASRLLAPGGRLVYWAGDGFDPASEGLASVSMRFSTSPTLADGGPLVIMAR
jgi:16S rRNA (guanine527-N7)-methyltransferase